MKKNIMELLVLVSVVAAQFQLVSLYTVTVSVIILIYIQFTHVSVWLSNDY